MHLIDEAGHVGNNFVRSNPATGQPATLIGADWPNMVQHELKSVLDAAGIAPVKGDNDQLATAIAALIQEALDTYGTAIGEGKWFEVENAWDATRFKEPQGQVLNRADYPALWALVSASSNLAVDAADKATNRTKWGKGNGATTFQMPDYQGIFQRVRSTVGGVVPAPGVFKANQNKAHTHDVPTSANDPNGSSIANGSPPDGWNGSTASSGGDEACPDHTTSWYVIRVK